MPENPIFIPVDLSILIIGCGEIQNNISEKGPGRNGFQKYCAQLTVIGQTKSQLHGNVKYVYYDLNEDKCVPKYFE